MPKAQHIKHEAASKGIAIGYARILTHPGSSFPKYWIADKDIPQEITRFKLAIIKSKQQLSKIKEKLCRFQGKEQIQIIDTHSMLLQDEMLITHAIQNITSRKINAEWALDKAASRLKMAFVDIRDEYFKQRKHDIDYISQRVIKNLTGTAELSIYDIKEKDLIVIANDMSPADIVAFKRERVKGIITSVGGNTSHSAIIARSLELPAMIGAESVMDIIKDGDVVIIDGVKNRIIVNPSKSELADYKKRQAVFEKNKHTLLKEAHLPAITLDNKQMSLVANIELIEETEPSINHGAEGIGLFRTEYLYAGRMDYPSEEEHFEAYKTVLEKMNGRPVTIRTLDIGGDKLFINSDYSEHINPALGLRAIRFCMVERDIFKTQLRALLRASVYGNLRLLIPMISCIEEIRQVKKLIETLKNQLLKENVKVSEKIDLGIMIEIPSAAILAETLAGEVDFFSIGTNDLVQYTLAVDRTNEHVSYLYNLLNPAVIKIIKTTVDAAKTAKIDVTVCGEAAGDPMYLLLFLGLGIESLSMNPISIPRVKKFLRTVKAVDAKMLVDNILKLNSVNEIEKIIFGAANRHLGIFERSKPSKP